MKAVQYSSYGDRQAIDVIEDAPRPVPGDGQIVAEVHAAALNPLDWKTRAGYLQQYIPLSFPVTPGGDFSGVVVELGPGATGWQVGDEVYGMGSVLFGCSASLAEYVTANAGQVAHTPATVSDTDAAALVLAGVSALQAMDDSIHPSPGRRVLVQGGAGGVGSIAIQYAKHLGAHVAVTARAERHDFVRRLGADEVVDYERQAFDTLLGDFDAVLDLVGGETYARSYRVLKPGGVIVSLIEPPNAELMAEHQVRAVMQAGDVSAARLEQLTRLVDDGVVRVYVDKVFPLDRAREAFDYLENEHPLSKVALRVR